MYYNGLVKMEQKDVIEKQDRFEELSIKKNDLDEYKIESIEDEKPDYSEGIYWAEGNETEEEFWEHE